MHIRKTLTYDEINNILDSISLSQNMKYPADYAEVKNKLKQMQQEIIGFRLNRFEQSITSLHL